MDSIVQEAFKVLFFKGFQNINLATGKQRRNHLKTRIFGGSANESDNTLLHSGKERILLTFVETVNFVDKENRRRRTKKGLMLSLF